MKNKSFFRGAILAAMAAGVMTLTANSAIAQTNTTCTNAALLNIGTDVALTGTADLWYYVYLENGKSYAFESSNGYSYLYQECDGYDVYGGNNYTYTIPESGNWYLKAYPYGSGASLRVSEVTDNRACGYATAITLGTSVTLPTLYTDYYYKVNLEAGKSYAFESIDGYAYLYDACGGYEVDGGSNYTYTVPESRGGEWYVKAYIYDDGGEFRVSEVTDNRACVYAQNIMAGANVLVPQSDVRYYYKFTPSASRLYQAVWKRGGSRGSFYQYNACNGNTIGNATDTLFINAQAGTQVLLAVRRGNDIDTFKLEQSNYTGNKVCDNAQSIALDAIVAHPGGDAYRYYKASLSANRTYVIADTSRNPSWGSYFYVKRACTDNNYINARLNSCTFTTTAAGDYLFYVDGNAMRFKLEELRDNRSCLYAQAMTADGTYFEIEGRNENRWFKLPVQAGETYAVKYRTNNGNIEFFSGCGSATLRSQYTNGEYIITAQQNGYVFVCAYPYEQNNAVSARHITDNSACGHATTIALNTETTTPTGQQYTYYKITLTAERYYAIQSSGSYSYYLYADCGMTTSYSLTSTNATQRPTGEYILRIRNYDYSQQGLTFKVVEHNDNRTCANAVAIALNQEVRPARSRTNYYSITLPEGRYKIEKLGDARMDVASVSVHCDSASLRTNYLEAGSYKFSVTGYAYGGDSTRFRVVAVSGTADSKWCSGAATASANGDTIRYNAPEGGTRYYNIALQAGKAYTAKSPDDMVVLLMASCGGKVLQAGNPWVSAGGEYPWSFFVDATATYKMALYPYSDSYTSGRLIIEEMPAGDNSICVNAQSIEFGVENVLPYPAQGQWYKVDIAAAGVYVLKQSYFDLYDLLSTCSGSSVPVSYDNGEYIFSAAAGAFYVRGSAYSSNNYLKISAVTPRVTQVKVSPATAEVAKGGSMDFTAEVVSVGDVARSVTWSVEGLSASLHSGTTISASGKLTVAAAQQTGSILVSAASTADNSKIGTALIDVKDAAAVTPMVLSVSISPSNNVQVAKGSERTFSAAVSVQGNITDKSVTWSVAGTTSTGTTITAAGVLKVSATETNDLAVRAKSNADNNVTAQVSVRVTAAGTTDPNNPVSVTGVSLNKTALTLANIGDKETLTATIAPNNANNRDVTWSSSNAAVATVSGTGEVTAVAKGTATVTVTTADGGKTATCAVTVGSNSVALEALPKLALYPNPVGSMLYVTDDFAGLVEVYDLNGTIVLTSTSSSINVSSLPSGVYVVKAGGKSAKIVKQ